MSPRTEFQKNEINPVYYLFLPRNPPPGSDGMNLDKEEVGRFGVQRSGLKKLQPNEIRIIFFIDGDSAASSNGACRVLRNLAKCQAVSI